MAKRRSSSRRSSTKTPKKTKTEKENKECESDAKDAESQELESQENDESTQSQTKNETEEDAEVVGEAENASKSVEEEEEKKGEDVKFENEENMEIVTSREIETPRDTEENKNETSLNASSDDPTIPKELEKKDEVATKEGECNETKMVNEDSTVDNNERGEIAEEHNDGAVTEKVADEGSVMKSNENMENRISSGEDGLPAPEKNEEGNNGGEEAINNEQKVDNANIVDLSDFDATDSQLCVFGEETAEKKSTKDMESEKENLGLRSGSEVIKDLMQDLADMNRLITRARNELQATKLKLNNTWKKNF